MKEVFKVGYTKYLEKPKSKKWTSKLGKAIWKNKAIISILCVIIICCLINFWLIYKFVAILEIN